jgi:putative zinc finger protein
VTTNQLMECTNPGFYDVTPERRQAGLETAEQVRHEVLWDYVRNSSAPQGLLGHLAECRHCTELRDSFERLNDALTRKDSHVLAVCPSPETLSAYQSGELAGVEREKLARHLEACAPCREDLDWLKRTAPSNVVEMPRRRWALVAAAAAALVVIGIAPKVVRHFTAPVFSDLAATPVLDKQDLRATLTQKERFLPLLEASFTSYDAGDFRGAESKARQILSTAPSEPSGLLMAGLAAYRRGDLAEAARLVTAAEQVKKSEYRCWTALQFALLTGERVGVDRECRHLDGHIKYRDRAREILRTVKQRTA